jgi:hypothetical protein
LIGITGQLQTTGPVTTSKQVAPFPFYIYGL